MQTPEQAEQTRAKSAELQQLRTAMDQRAVELATGALPGKAPAAPPANPDPTSPRSDSKGTTMTSKTPTGPADIAAQAQAAADEHQRLTAQADLVRAAGENARRAAKLASLHGTYRDGVAAANDEIRRANAHTSTPPPPSRCRSTSAQRRGHGASAPIPSSPRSSTTFNS